MGYPYPQYLLSFINAALLLAEHPGYLTYKTLLDLLDLLDSFDLLLEPELPLENVLKVVLKNVEQSAHFFHHVVCVY